MSEVSSESEKRKRAALAEMRRIYGTDDDEFGATLFVSHHLEELGAPYWEKHLGTAAPEPIRVLDILEVKPNLVEGDDAIESIDFTLPDEVTNYVICVRFDASGEVQEIAMES